MRGKVRRRVGNPDGFDPATCARLAGLRYVNDGALPCIRRMGGKKRFHYVSSTGSPVRDSSQLQRIRALAIPPAWRDVWICPDPRGHLQATGRDARGRRQYRYHAQWREVRDEVKYGRLITFAGILPSLRRRTDAHLRRPGLSREKVLAAVVRLLEKTLIRVGNEEYARENKSVGLTTMRDGHAKVTRGAVHFEFRGKSGIKHAIALRDRRLAAIVKSCRDLPGQDLFQYLDGDGLRQSIGSADVNAYLRGMTGRDFTAKDFRTWAGTVLAAKALASSAPARSKTHAKREIARAIESVAQCLGNTKAVCRKSYIHPAILDAYADGATIQTAESPSPPSRRGLDATEAAVVALIARRLRRKAA